MIKEKVAFIEKSGENIWTIGQKYAKIHKSDRKLAPGSLSGCCPGVGRLPWEQEAARSNRATRTI